jgi:hypothetical protein
MPILRTVVLPTFLFGLFLGEILAQGGGLRENLGKLEKGPGFDTRLAGARFFAKRTKSPGVDVLEALLAETKLREVRKAILVAVGELRGASRGRVFREGIARLSGVRQLGVLKILKKVHTPHVDVFRLRARKDGYIPLAVEALSQDAKRGDSSAAKALRKLAKKKGLSSGVLGSILEALIPVAVPGDLGLFAILLERGGLRSEIVWEEGLKTLRARPGVLDAATQLIEAKSPIFRAVSLRLLAQKENSLPLLRKGLRDPSLKVRRIAQAALIVRKDPAVIPFLLERARKGSLQDRIDALEGLDSLWSKDEGFQKTFEQLLREQAIKGPSDIRIFAFHLAARRKLNSFSAFIPGLLSSPDWRFRVVACELARRIRKKESIPFLIRAMAKSKGREREELEGALHSLTRLFFLQPEGWKRWWAKEGRSFDLPPPPHKKEREDPTKKEKTSARFYGLPVSSLRVAFVLDVSGSMRQPSGTGNTRMQVARRELSGVLMRLSGEAKVNLIFFDTDVHPFSKHLVPLGKKGLRKKLLDFVQKATPLGATNLSDALAKAFSDPRIDTIYVLSDGEPTAGKIQDPERLLREVARWNRSRLLRLHCVSIGRASSLLAELARRSGGRYVKK